MIYGEQEAPDWLAPNILRMSRFNENSIKVLTEAVIESFITKKLKYSKIKHCIISDDQIGEVKAILGTLHLIIKNAIKYGLSEAMLASDLQLLGLPNCYQLAICRPYSDNKIELAEVLSSDLVIITHDLDFDWNIQVMVNEKDGRFLSNEIIMHINSPSLIFQIQDGVEKRVSTCDFSISETNYNRLNNELRKVDALMSFYSSTYCYLFH